MLKQKIRINAWVQVLLLIGLLLSPTAHCYAEDSEWYLGIIVNGADGAGTMEFYEDNADAWVAKAGDSGFMGLGFQRSVSFWGNDWGWDFAFKAGTNRIEHTYLRNDVDGFSGRNKLNTNAIIHAEQFFAEYRLFYFIYNGRPDSSRRVMIGPFVGIEFAKSHFYGSVYRAYGTGVSSNCSQAILDSDATQVETYCNKFQIDQNEQLVRPKIGFTVATPSVLFKSAGPNRLTIDYQPPTWFIRNNQRIRYDRGLSLNFEILF
ncbi:MAG: hypothetical protein RRB13_08880 [bacterium]|nr:hypothetical protein [bacterium]